MESSSHPVDRRFKRFVSALVVGAMILFGVYLGDIEKQNSLESPPTTGTSTVVTTNDQQLTTFQNALAGLDSLPVKGRAPKTGYSRNQFGSGWEKSGTCDMRNKVLARDLTVVSYQGNSCIVESGNLNDPYSGKIIAFTRGAETSSAVQIDHVVALSDAWQKGAQLLTPTLRTQLANDGLELLAVDGPTNQNKGDGDAATWLPPNKSFRCTYVARQVSVKIKYSLWVTAAERDAIKNILSKCPDEPLVK